MPDGTRARGTLYVVATPIGNLGDITLRALDVLRSVAVVAAEDTRRTRRIWSKYDLETPLVSYHAHSDSARTRELLARLERGEDVALVTDAGEVPLSRTAARKVDAALARADRKTKTTRERTAAKPPANADEVATATALIAEVETLSGEAYTQRLGEDDVQRALETVAAANGHRDRDTPLADTIDASAEEADAA